MSKLFTYIKSIKSLVFIFKRYNKKSKGFVFVPFLIQAGAAIAAGGLAWVYSDELLKGVIGAIMLFLEFVQTMISSLVAISKFLLDFVIDKTIINSNLGNIEAINIGWAITRDLVNMFFIFIILYIAIATILNIGNYKKTLVTLVIVALLVNFSLFTTKIVIDASNIFSIGFYNQMGLSEVSLADKLMGKGLKIQKVFEVEKEEQIDKDNVSKSISLFLSIIFLSVTAWVLFNMSFLLVGRFIAFIFLMILSPLAFMSFILPGLKSKIFDEWWKTLISQSMIAPIFFFLFYLIVKIIEQDPFNYTLAEDVNRVSLLFNFVVLIGLMMYALKITKKLSGEIGASSTTWGKKATGFVAGGAVGVAGRHVVGRAAKGIADSDRVKRTLNRSRLGRTMYGAIDKTAGASFDVRNVRGVSKELGKGSGGGGYKKYTSAQTNKIQSRVAQMSTGSDGSPLYAQAGKEEVGSYHTRNGKVININKGDKMPKLDAQNYIITNDKGEVQYEKESEKIAREMITPPKTTTGKFMKNIRSITGRDRIERDAAAGIRKEKTGKESTLDKLKKEIKEELKKETSKDNS